MLRPMASLLPPTPARSLRAAALGLALAALLAPSTALAQDGDEPPAEGDPLLAATPIQLRVEPADHGQWKMTLTNRSDATWRVAADARLLTVELIGAPLPDAVAKKQKGGAKPRSFPRSKITRCQMPAGMRPAGITPSRSLVLKPGEHYVELVHPVALCGAATILDSLGPGAVVYPSFGTPEKTKKNAPPRPLPPPPYVAQPLREQEGVMPLRWLAATPFLMPSPDDVATSDATADNASPDKPSAQGSPAPVSGSAPAPASGSVPAPAPSSAPDGAAPPATPAAEPDDYAPRLSLQGRRRADASNARNALLSATLRNTGKVSATMRLRSDALVFRVKPLGASRAFECGFANPRRANARDFFTTLSAGKSRDLSALLGELCPQGTLERPGVYEIWPRVDLHETGESFDLAAVTGSFVAPSPTLLRLRSGDLPYHERPPEALGPDGAPPKSASPDASKGTSPDASKGTSPDAASKSPSPGASSKSPSPGAASKGPSPNAAPAEPGSRRP